MKNTFATLVVVGAFGFLCTKFYKDYKEAMDELVVTHQKVAVLEYENNIMRKKLRKDKHK